MMVIVMGVAGAGKSTVGQALAQDLGWTFIEGDALHPPENIAKMSRGVPLTEGDRLPWLLALQRVVAQQQVAEQSAVLACSALRRRYRAVLQAGATPGAVRWVYLRGSADLLRARLNQRTQHFMKADLLASQLAVLEEPTPAEGAIAVNLDVMPSVATIVASIRQQLGL